MLFPKPTFILLGFLIVASISSWTKLKQARVIDAQGDLISLQAEISELKQDINELNLERSKDDTKADRKKKINTEIEDIEKDIKSLAEERAEENLDVTNAKSSAANGIWLQTLILQFGAIIFGVGLIGLFSKKEEDSYLKMAALLVLGYILAQGFLN